MRTLSRRVIFLAMRSKRFQRYLVLFAAVATIGAAPAAASTQPVYCDPLGGCPTHHHKKTHHKVKRCTTKRVRRHHRTVRVRACKTVWVYS
jgi:hypothetical protein